MSKTVGSSTTYYLYDGDALIAEVDASTDQVTKAYTWGANGLVSDHEGTQSRFYLFDALGNARSLLDPNGNLLASAAYTAYGTPLGTPLPSTPFGWQGQAGCRTDSETGWVYMQARYYAPSLGRFVSRDPIGFAGGINLYGYCYGDPVNYWDPNGTDGFIGIPGGTIAGAAGFFGVAIASRNPVLGVIGGAAIGTGWSYYRDHKDLKTSIADGCMGGLIGNGIDDALVAGRAYLNYRAIPPPEAEPAAPPAETASEPEAAAENANAKTFCRLRAKLSSPCALKRRMLKLGLNPPGTEAHHEFPVKFQDVFSEHGIDINDPQYGRWVENHTHRQFSYEYNKQWEKFLANPDNNNYEAIHEFLTSLRNSGRFQ